MFLSSSKHEMSRQHSKVTHGYTLIRLQRAIVFRSFLDLGSCGILRGSERETNTFSFIHGEVMLELLNALVHDTDFLWGEVGYTSSAMHHRKIDVCVCDVLKQSSAIKRNASLYFAVYSYTLRMIAGERDSVASRRERSGWTSGTVVLLALLAYGGSITTESCRVLYAAV